MSPTISLLRSWSTDSMTAAGDAAQSAAATLDAALDATIRAFDGAVLWRGATHDAACVRVTQERDHADEVRNVLNQIADEAKDAAADIAHARDYVLRQVASALAQGFTVSDTGEVSRVANSADDDSADDNSADNDKASSLQAQIQHGLNTVGVYDTDYGNRIADLATDLATMVNGQPDVRLPDGTYADADDLVRRLSTMRPTEIRATLEAMSPSDVRRLIAADPIAMGRLDGVPFPLRANANEVNIRNALADERQAGRGNGPRARRLIEFLRQVPDPRKAEGFDDPRAGDGADDHLVERSFIVFDNTENGHFIEMIGQLRPGTPNAAVYVPGTGTNMNDSASNTKSAWNLSKRTGGPVFVYADGNLPQKMGYEEWPKVASDALTGGAAGARALGPAGIVPGALLGSAPALASSINDSALDPQLARDLAPGLVSFGHALDAEIEATCPDAKTTYIGHSYGGSVVGSAEQLGLRADRVIYASSAGTGVFDTPWSNRDVERYSLTAPGDLIQASQSLPGNPHGADPDTAEGVIRMDTGYYGEHNPDNHGLVQGLKGHGEYWDDPDSDAFENMAKVVRGETPTPYVERAADMPGSDAAHAYARRATVGAADAADTAEAVIPPLVALLDELRNGQLHLPRLPDVPLHLPR